MKKYLAFAAAILMLAVLNACKGEEIPQKVTNSEMTDIPLADSQPEESLWQNETTQTPAQTGRPEWLETAPTETEPEEQRPALPPEETEAETQPPEEAIPEETVETETVPEETVPEETTEETAPAEPVWLTYEEFMALSSQEQMEYWYTFQDPMDYITWYQTVIGGHDQENQPDEGEGNEGMITQPTVG